MRLLATYIIVIAAVVVNGALWTLANVPLRLPPLPADSADVGPAGGNHTEGGDARLASVSFAPFRDGQNPLIHSFPTTDQIEQDLIAVKPLAASIRTYSQEGLAVVPELARKHGLTVTLGAWLGGDLAHNEQEIAALIAAANRYPEVVKRVIIGNEVLLRQDLRPWQLRAYLRRVKAAVRQPVGYADVWEFWLKYPEIAPEVDFLTIHLLPYWENEPTAVADAPARVLKAYRTIADRFPGKPILVGETGWPSAGRTRGPAETGVANAAWFFNAFVRLAHEQGFDYNLIEAFDQSWKVRLEGTVGGKWGLLTTDRQPKFPLTGPVTPAPDWPAGLGIAALLGLIAFAGVLPWPRPSTQPWSARRLALEALGLQFGGSALVLSASVAAACYTFPLDHLFIWTVVALEAVVAAAMVATLVQTPTTAGIEPPKWGKAALLALLIIFAVWTWLLVCDGRYRNFPVAHALIPALAPPLLVLLRPGANPWPAGTCARDAQRPWRRRLRALVIAGPVLALLAGAPAIILGEGLANHGDDFWAAATEPLARIAEGLSNREAVLWALLQLCLALPMLGQADRAVRVSIGREAPEATEKS